jgi:hypothetical protein
MMVQLGHSTTGPAASAIELYAVGFFESYAPCCDSMMVPAFSRAIRWHPCPHSAVDGMDRSNEFLQICMRHLRCLYPMVLSSARI